MFRFLSCCLLLSVLTPMLRADDIVVYRGTVRPVIDAQTAATFSKIVKTYLVVNYTTRESYQILYYNSITKKKDSSITQYRIDRAVLPNSKNISIFVAGETVSTDANNHTYSCVLLRGVDVALTIKTKPTRTTIERPRSLTGDALTVRAETGEPTVMQDSSVTYSVDNVRTLDANNNDKTVTAVRDEILAALTAQGYLD